MSQAIIDAIQSKYGLTVGEGDLKLCVRDISRGRARLLSQESSRIAHYLLRVQNTGVAVAVDLKDDVITQVLDPMQIAP